MASVIARQVEMARLTPARSARPRASAIDFTEAIGTPRTSSRSNPVSDTTVTHTPFCSAPSVRRVNGVSSMSTSTCSALSAQLEPMLRIIVRLRGGGFGRSSWRGGGGLRPERGQGLGDPAREHGISLVREVQRIAGKTFR
jgi:hypothetical protein